MSAPIETTMTAADHDAAFTEVSFLLQMLAQTVESVIGNPAPLGVSAGRAMAAKLPVHIVEPDLGKVLTVLSPHLKEGFDYESQEQEKGAVLSVGHCVIRDLAAKQGEAPGGKLCKLYHAYLSGMISHLLTRQSRVQETAAGETCTLTVQTR